MIQTPKYILYDYNGTLLNDAYTCFQCFEVLLQEHHLPSISYSFYRDHFNFPLEDFYRLCHFPLDNNQFIAYTQRFFELYDQAFGQVELFDDVFEHLEAHAHIPKIILSAAKHSRLQVETRLHKLDLHFEKIYGIQDDFAKSKIHLVNLFLQEFQANPTECLFIGDTLHDYEVAQSVQMPCILIDRGHQSQNQWQNLSEKVQFHKNFAKISFPKQPFSAKNTLSLK